MAVSEQIVELLAPILEKVNVSIFDCTYKKEGKDFYLRIFVDKNDGTSIDLDTIVAISELVGPALDEADLLKTNYMLDVASVGAERPIRLNEFPMFIGKYINVHLINAVNGQNFVEGDLLAASDDKIVMQERIKTRVIEVEVLKSNIDRARLAIKF